MDDQALGERRGAFGHRGGQARGEHRVDLDGVDGGHLGQQGQRERAEARPDLQHHVVRRQLGRPHDAAHGVGVVHEVLPQPLGRAQIQLRGQRPHLDRAEQPRLAHRHAESVHPAAAAAYHWGRPSFREQAGQAP